MRSRLRALWVGGLTLSASSLARAAPPFCADVGDSFAFGVSSYGDVRQWAGEAKQAGADFRFVYVYVLADGMSDPQAFEDWYVRPFLESAKAIDATPVCTFYQLLNLGQAAGYTGEEAAVVQAALADPAVMHTYFDHFIWLLTIAQSYPPPVVVHVEPDSWGFMMWSMGVEGNADPTSIEVAVASSGHADVGGFANDAAGLGQALVALRDAYAPDVQLGWHASNFRVGTRPDVVASFFAPMGAWDLLVSEHPHLEPVPAAWWEPWDEALIGVNLEWMRVVTESSGLPLMLWQMPVGTTDWHQLGALPDLSMLGRFAEAGAVALLFEHLNNTGATDPDDYRAVGELGTAPPSEHAEACGTAGCMRERVAAYSLAPLAIGAGSPCAAGAAGGAGGQTGGGGAGAGPATGGAGADPPGGPPALAAADESGCGCRAPGPHRDSAPALLVVTMALGLGWARTRYRPRPT